MTCQHIEPQLNALADRELNPWQAARVRRHVAACPACAAEYADIQRLDASVQAWRDAPAPFTLGARIAAALPLSAACQTRPRTFPLRPAAVGLAGIAATIAAILWFLPGQPGQPTLAYADVERAMQQVQIVSWKSHLIVTDANWYPLANQKPAGSGSVTWLRRSPPAIATIGQPDGFRNLEDKRGSLQRTAQGNYVVFPPPKQGEKGLADTVESLIKGVTEEPMLPTVPHPAYDVSSRITNRQQQSVMLSGQRRILFTYDERIIVYAIMSHGREVFPETHLFIHSSTWADPTTHLVTRIETRRWVNYVYTKKQFSQPNQRMIYIDSDFRYNQVPPPVIFDWSPPKGANVIDARDLRVGKGLRLYLPKKAKTNTKGNKL